ncbi:hypothetical protein ACFL6A_03435 [bacterium]
MLCRNRVGNYPKWKAVFDSHLQAQQDSGLQLINMWRSIEEPNNVFFLFEITNMDKAREFVSNPEAAKAGDVSGVIDGEIHFVENAPGY